MKVVVLALALVAFGAQAETPSQELARLKAETKAIKVEIRELKASSDLEKARQALEKARAKRSELKA